MKIFKKFMKISFVSIFLFLLTGCPGLLSDNETVTYDAPLISGITAGYFNSKLVFSISGIEGLGIEYSLDDGNKWIQYSGEITLSDEGTYLVCARQKDGEGNFSPKTETITLVIDKTIPLSPELSGLAAGFFNSAQSFSLSGEEGAVIEYTLDGGITWLKFSGKVSFSENGVYNLNFRQTDRAGNVSVLGKAIVITIKTDLADPPSLTGLSSGFFNYDISFTLEGENGASLEYSLDGGESWLDYQEKVILTVDNKYTITARQTDKYGNLSSQSSPIDVVIDTVVPAVPVIADLESGLFNSDRNLSISGEENAILEYTLDGGTEWKEYTEKITLSSEGSYTVKARQTDRAGNVSEESNSITFSLDKTIPTVTYKAGDIYSFTSKLTFTFSESMDPLSLKLSRSLVDDNTIIKSWTKTNLENDTLTISAKTSWTVGFAKELLVAASDLAGNPMDDLDLICDPGYVFVNINYSGSGSDGSRSTPFRSISEAVNVCPSGFTVCVAKGSYNISSSITMKNEVNLLGGFSASTWIRDIDANPVLVKDTRITGGSETDYNSVFVAGSGIGTSTVLDGFTINAGGGDYGSAGVACTEGGSPTISHNTISGGSDVQESCGIMIYLDGSAPVITGNTIDGGSSSVVSTSGIRNYQGNPIIRSNTISGGSGSEATWAICDMPLTASTISGNILDGGPGYYTCYGIQNLGGATVIYNNVIDGGSGGKGTANDDYPEPGTYGVSLGDSTVKLYNNTIDSGSGSTSYAVWLGNSPKEGSICTSDIRNNILFCSSYVVSEPIRGEVSTADSYGIFEYTDNCNPSQVSNNCFFWVGMLYKDSANGSVTPVGAIGPENVSSDPGFISGTDWHLSGNSPSDVANGGQDLSSSGVTTDIEGNTRTDPYSMGAYEKDGIPFQSPPH